ncbi:cysteine synthase [Venturia nashicola]|uniref:Cysteine synthase n=1 Tax=Venturia nashicola TaxID=86259 RepID=A0A4Z1PUE2_9PEZI|nr:cysteine synthase [Venturia nashicola]TLD39698.1 cysteine synthase [Venturia nashicola]
MAEIPYNNVFKGPDSVINYFDPDLQPPLPLVELPEKLNHFRRDGVRIYAKMLTATPAQNVKVFPALNMLLHEPAAAKKSIVEASSGSTALSLGMAARVLWGNEDVTAHLTNKKHPDQLRMLQFFGLKISLYGGLAQQEPVDPRGVMCRLRRLAKKDDQVIYPGQYDNDYNWKSHVRWTGSQIFKQLPEINVFCTTVGTGGCISGTGVYLKAQKPSVKVVGVCNVFGDPTPGPRHFPGFESSQFPWRETIDTFEHVASVRSYEKSMQLSREGIICGPSSGEGLCGLFDYLQKAKDAGTLQDLADPITGEISCVFICCDLPYQYMDNYFQKLDEDKFPQIYNKILLSCDQDKYDERWELTPEQSARMIAQSSRTKRGPRPCSRPSCRTKPLCNSSGTPKITILDLRQKQDFDTEHMCGSASSPLKQLTERSGDIFADSIVLHMHWRNLKTKFEVESDKLGSKACSLLVLCYDGETSRLAVSILRARGFNAFSVFGGFHALTNCVKARKL